ncbi:hypothetical protein F4677DRAFT_438615 [Hypoxylon crocopeplum]|nr:hypothetical protein F4677DRAFT_438615 [Hypoxylon crocopeplum]
MFDLCYCANEHNDQCLWAQSITGLSVYGMMVDKLMSNLDPDEFVLTIFALLSYFRLRNRNQAFHPTPSCENFFKDQSWGYLWNATGGGALLERVAMEVMTLQNAIPSVVPELPHMLPLGLVPTDRVMENDPSTVRLGLYCATRMRRTCSHGRAIIWISEGFDSET